MQEKIGGQFDSAGTPDFAVIEARSELLPKNRLPRKRV